MGIIIFGLSLIPIFLILWLLYFLDNEKESLKILIMLFVGGCLSMVITKFLSNKMYLFDPDMLYGDATFLQQFLEKFSLVGMVEELSKWLILYVLVWRNKEFNYRYDGIVYAVYVSMGFAVVENFFYMFEDPSIVTLISRSIMTIPAHASFGIVMGAYISDAKYYIRYNGFFYRYLSFFVPLILHGIYDFLLSFEGSLFKFFIIYFIILLVYALRKLWVCLFKENIELKEEMENRYEKRF